MKVTMLLCDAAQVADGKLYILGGGWSVIGPDPMYSAIAIKIDVDWSEVDRPHHWELFLSDEDGQPVMIPTLDGLQPFEVRGDFEVSRPPSMPAGTPVDVVYAVGIPPFPLSPGARFIWRLTIDGETDEDWVLSFSTRDAAD